MGIETPWHAPSYAGYRTVYFKLHSHLNWHGIAVSTRSVERVL